jgi:glycine hydroxymethyltransferase
MNANGSILINKYVEELLNKRYYDGYNVVDEVEQLAIDRLKELFGTTWTSLQPHSGSQANAAFFLFKSRI